MKNENYTSYVVKYMYKVWYMKHENKIKQNSLSKNQIVQGCVRIFLWRKKKTCLFIIYIMYKNTNDKHDEN
jgi:hypothetical protein